MGELNDDRPGGTLWQELNDSRPGGTLCEKLMLPNVLTQ